MRVARGASGGVRCVRRNNPRGCVGDAYVDVLDGNCYFLGGAVEHKWELPVLHYHKIMVIYPYPFLVVIAQFFS